jgi:uncharacterized cupredoxin-like copper-binding protein
MPPRAHKHRHCHVAVRSGCVRAGTVGWVTVTLPAGHYELVCNLANHYADGMYQEFVVNSS